MQHHGSNSWHNVEQRNQKQKWTYFMSQKHLKLLYADIIQNSSYLWRMMNDWEGIRKRVLESDYTFWLDLEGDFMDVFIL